jgi:hypothetical protein
VYPIGHGLDLGIAQPPKLIKHVSVSSEAGAGVKAILDRVGNPLEDLARITADHVDIVLLQKPHFMCFPALACDFSPCTRVPIETGGMSEALSVVGIRFTWTLPKHQAFSPHAEE